MRLVVSEKSATTLSTTEVDELRGQLRSSIENMSTNRRKVPWRMVGWGVGLQITFGLLVLLSWWFLPPRGRRGDA